MKHFFVKNLYIHHIRHLDKLIIPVDSEKMQHLILTGKNGSGKTSVLNEIKYFIDILLKNDYEEQTNDALDKLIYIINDLQTINCSKKLLYHKADNSEIKQRA